MRRRRAGGTARAAARRVSGRGRRAPVRRACPRASNGARSALDLDAGLYNVLLDLRQEAIGRIVLVPPMPLDLPREEQVEHILRHAKVVECNEAFAAIHGGSAASMKGRPLPCFMPDHERRGPVRRFVDSAYRVADLPVTHTGADGQTRALAVAALGEARDGFLLGYWVTVQDVTEKTRIEAERARRDVMLEAVAFGAARLLEAGSWRLHMEAVLARLGGASDVARAWIGEVVRDPDGCSRVRLLCSWGIAGHAMSIDDPRLRGGLSFRGAGLENAERELRANRPVTVTLRGPRRPEHDLLNRVGSRGFAAVPVLVGGELWGVLGFGETRRDREWSVSELEALKAAAAVIGAAVARERGHTALLESKERFHRLSAAAFEGVAITEDGAFVDGNDQLARMLGCEVSELIGRRVEDFVAPEDRELVESHIRSGSEEPYHHRARRTDGSAFPVEVRARALPHAGRTVRVTAVRDVTERLEAEEQRRHLEADLRHAAEEWRQTFDALDLGIVLACPEGRVERLNRRALELATGSGFSDVIGRSLAEMADREPWSTLLDIHWRVSTDGRSVVGEARDPSTARSFYLLGSPWFREEGEPPWCVLTFRDVTEFTNMQAQLRRARTLEAMGSLVAGVAHEVRNPLFSISATVDALESEFGKRPEFAEYSVLLRSQVVRLTQLMRDLIDYGKPSGLRPSPTRVGDIVRRAMRSCSTLAREKQVRLEEEVASELPAIRVEGARVEQAVENLLANAIQHSPAGAAVRIRAGLEARGGEESLLCAVEDEGPGVAPEDHDRIFEPFFSRRKGGTGLGLPIVQRVAEAHGGTVSVQNRAEGGARFTLVLPVREAPAGGA